MSYPSYDLTLKRFSEINLARCKRWHPNGINSWSHADWLQALVGELGEAANVMKKLRRIEDGIANVSDETIADTQIALDRIAEELADTFIYLNLLASSYEIDLEKAVIEKFNKVSEKYGFPERLW